MHISAKKHKVASAMTVNPKKAKYNQIGKASKGALQSKIRGKYGQTLKPQKGFTVAV